MVLLALASDIDRANSTSGQSAVARNTAIDTRAKMHVGSEMDLYKAFHEIAIITSTTNATTATATSMKTTTTIGSGGNTPVTPNSNFSLGSHLEAPLSRYSLSHTLTQNLGLGAGVLEDGMDCDSGEEREDVDPAQSSPSMSSSRPLLGGSFEIVSAIATDEKGVLQAVTQAESGENATKSTDRRSSCRSNDSRQSRNNIVGRSPLDGRSSVNASDFFSVLVFKQYLLVLVRSCERSHPPRFAEI